MEAQGLDIVLEVRESGASEDPWQEIICITDDGSSMASDVNVVQTRCGPKTGVTPGTREVTGNGVADSDPTVNQTTLLQMQQWANENTALDFRRYNRANGTVGQGEVVNMQGTAYVTQVDETATVGEAVQFSFTLTATGDVAIGAAIS